MTVKGEGQRKPKCGDRWVKKKPGRTRLLRRMLMALALEGPRNTAARRHTLGNLADQIIQGAGWFG